MYKEDIIKLISELLGDRFVISCLSCNISRDEHGIKMTEDSYSIHLYKLSQERVETIYEQLLKYNKESYYLNK